MKETFRKILENLSLWFPRSLLVRQGPLTKPDLIERNIGVVLKVTEWAGKSIKGKACDGAKEAEVKVNNGNTVDVFIPPRCKVIEGEQITIALLKSKGSEHMFYVYSKHLTSSSSRRRR
ncbi:MAG: hypothetical protein N0E54_04225 [Candidatus Thiodiazotropha taylori]|nr:hypothetical protein [Candidatus Thiodiazotropha endolucinida]MCW4227936.1 hypothetical protein [Candidatus Thiodiazotropha taylori]